MHKEVFEAKTKEEAVKEALKKLNKTEEELIITEKEVKKGLFSKKIEIEVITKEEVNKTIKEYLLFLVHGLGLDGNIETKTRDDILTFNIVSKDNPILIGKNGRTIEAMQNLTIAMLNKELSSYYRFIVDVNDYKLKRKARLEKLAKYTAKDVAKTKIEVKLEPMNAYERRIIHNVLSNSKDVTTESTGEEPNRSVVIKPKELK